MWYQIGLRIAVLAGALAAASAAVSATQPAFHGQTSGFDFAVTAFQPDQNTGKGDALAELDVGAECALWTSGCTVRRSVVPTLQKEEAPQEVRASLSRPMSLGLAALWFSATLVLMSSLAGRIKLRG